MAKLKKNTISKKPKRKFAVRKVKATVTELPAEDMDLEPEADSWDEVGGDEEIKDITPKDVMADNRERARLRDLKRYPPPKLNKTFVARWNDFMPDIVKRENFKPGHLSQLKILCDLYVEYEKLSDFVDTKGYTYKTVGRHGMQHKPWPQVAQRNRCLSEIRMYAKTLGLLLVKDKDVTPDKGTQEEWD